MPLARTALVEGTVPLASPVLLARMLAAEAVLCPLIGLAAWLVWRRIDIGLERKRTALRRWGWVLMLSALWPVASIDLHRPALALCLLILAFATSVWTGLSFRRLQPGAALLLLPYTAWIGVMAGIAAAHI